MSQLGLHGGGETLQQRGGGGLQQNESRRSPRLEEGEDHGFVLGVGHDREVGREPRPHEDLEERHNNNVVEEKSEPDNLEGQDSLQAASFFDGLPTLEGYLGGPLADVGSTYSDASEIASAVGQNDSSEEGNGLRQKTDEGASTSSEIFDQRGVFQLVGLPGVGKTRLLEQIVDKRGTSTGKSRRNIVVLDTEGGWADQPGQGRWSQGCDRGSSQEDSDLGSSATCAKQVRRKRIFDLPELRRFLVAEAASDETVASGKTSHALDLLLIDSFAFLVRSAEQSLENIASLLFQMRKLSRTVILVNHVTQGRVLPFVPHLEEELRLAEDLEKRSPTKTKSSQNDPRQADPGNNGESGELPRQVEERRKPETSTSLSPPLPDTRSSNHPGPANLNKRKKAPGALACFEFDVSSDEEMATGDPSLKRREMESTTSARKRLSSRSFRRPDPARDNAATSSSRKRARTHDNAVDDARRGRVDHEAGLGSIFLSSRGPYCADHKGTTADTAQKHFYGMLMEG
ncbi:unnamed protein product [Amoebophrya sp. A25]|nr:unnamed protein product [Amoebophrya sp. A25]|eukprot:GSA25T00017178001.1